MSHQPLSGLPGLTGAGSVSGFLDGWGAGSVSGFPGGTGAGSVNGLPGRVGAGSVSGFSTLFSPCNWLLEIMLEIRDRFTVLFDLHPGSICFSLINCRLWAVIVLN